MRGANNAGCSVASAPFDITESALFNLTASAIENRIVMI
jgi:hypothetical protein